MGDYFVGVDLGQRRDHTAIAVCERVESAGAWDPVVVAWRKHVALHLRYLERIPLGTSYVDVVNRVVEVTRSADLRDNCRIAVDGTGAGRPVVDMLKQADPRGILMRTVITGGDTETMSEGYYGIPKRDLIVGLQLVLEREGLKIAGQLPFGEELLAEMADMQVKVTGAGNEQYGAWREGKHDDLVFAVALACWSAKKVYPWELAGAKAYCRFPM